MADWDYLPGPNFLEPVHLPCEVWPADPPRVTMYAPDAFVAHPLVALLLAPSWEGAPPLYVCTGWELLADEGKYIATKAHADGVKAVHEEYEGMPHCFAMLLTGLPGARRCLDGWGGFIRKVVEEPEKVDGRFVTIKARTLKEVAVDPADVRPYTEEEIGRRFGNGSRYEKEEQLKARRSFKVG